MAMVLKDHYAMLETLSDEQKLDLVVQKAKIIKESLPGVEVEICGLWVWVKETKKEMAPTLKENNFLWASKKMAWYFPGQKAAFAKGKTLAEIERDYQAVKL